LLANSKDLAAKLRSSGLVKPKVVAGSSGLKKFPFLFVDQLISSDSDFSLIHVY
jgi:hypothetical protein